MKLFSPVSFIFINIQYIYHALLKTQQVYDACCYKWAGWKMHSKTSPLSFSLSLSMEPIWVKRCWHCFIIKAYSFNKGTLWRSGVVKKIKKKTQHKVHMLKLGKKNIRWENLKEMSWDWTWREKRDGLFRASNHCSTKRNQNLQFASVLFLQSFLQKIVVITIDYKDCLSVFRPIMVKILLRNFFLAMLALWL